MTLDQLGIDVPARVRAVDTGDPVMLRLMEMGLVPGAPVQIRKMAPFGGPMELQVRDYLLSIRRDQARRLIVEREP
jgi:Fe2+ transport system protein FeoA